MIRSWVYLKVIGPVFNTETLASCQLNPVSSTIWYRHCPLIQYDNPHFCACFLSAVQPLRSLWLEREYDSIPISHLISELKYKLILSLYQTLKSITSQFWEGANIKNIWQRHYCCLSNISSLFRKLSCIRKFLYFLYWKNSHALQYCQ